MGNMGRNMAKKPKLVIGIDPAGFGTVISCWGEYF